VVMEECEGVVERERERERERKRIKLVRNHLSSLEEWSITDAMTGRACLDALESWLGKVGCGSRGKREGDLWWAESDK
jgi:hypothetical protein